MSGLSPPTIWRRLLVYGGIGLAIGLGIGNKLAIDRLEERLDTHIENVVGAESP